MSADDAIGTVAELMANALNIEQKDVDMDAELESIGVDELVNLEIVMEIEDETGLKIPDVDIEKITTGRGLAEYVESRMKKI